MPFLIFKVVFGRAFRPIFRVISVGKNLEPATFMGPEATSQHDSAMITQNSSAEIPRPAMTPAETIGTIRAEAAPQKIEMPPTYF